MHRNYLNFNISPSRPYQSLITPQVYETYAELLHYLRRQIFIFER